MRDGYCDRGDPEHDCVDSNADHQYPVNTASCELRCLFVENVRRRERTGRGIAV